MFMNAVGYLASKGRLFLPDRIRQHLNTRGKFPASRKSAVVGGAGDLTVDHRVCVLKKTNSSVPAFSLTRLRMSALSDCRRIQCISSCSSRDGNALPRDEAAFRCWSPAVSKHTSSSSIRMLGSARYVASCVSSSMDKASCFELDLSVYGSLPKALPMGNVSPTACNAPVTPSKTHTRENVSLPASSVCPREQFPVRIGGESWCLSQRRVFSSYADFGKQLRGNCATEPKEGKRGSYGGNPPNPSGGSAGRDNACGDRQISTSESSDVLVSTTPTIPGYSITGYKGLVQGCSVRSRDVLRMTKVVLMVHLGGEMDDLTTLISRVKREAVNRMCEAASARGANGVVGVRIVSSGTHQKVAVEFSAYGTAVTVAKD
ncbi:putative DUF74 family protein [Toxoplasma gondii TgCatPRC2]|uniref:DUF74 family protein, putative n=5 Tax=Toxoplasma gondii TaxID=5811 RepID=A0A125YY70_TOXGM|nr:DUF74 family protein, putative [Toxoplasma gondii ME49]EPR58256.1 putative DUF74 family protein [Toxoplasma gondii GT1]KAF4645060.1 putative DUF74 family protein [Toxoplasma gondii]KYF39452.1 putative DUF74 family protein [Toxoplasma gondii ARI]KYK63873.1 putative DUF74 family protein [Toxoplasma gondii TgCatPRC2]EPT31391.1 DUF74 family protein, putative [Toxoplasma gondii ME49]|eukprot:XP_002371265.2 DUF74 family protein, putative [Toxoplasma gondii ME49]